MESIWKVNYTTDKIGEQQSVTRVATRVKTLPVQKGEELQTPMIVSFNQRQSSPTPSKD